MESGLLAARTLRAARGNYHLEALTRYLDAIEERLGKRHPSRRLGPADLLPAPLARGLAGRLLATHWFAHRVVIDRWFLHRAQNPLPDAG